MLAGILFLAEALLVLPVPGPPPADTDLHTVNFLMPSGLLTGGFFTFRLHNPGNSYKNSG